MSKSNYKSASDVIFLILATITYVFMFSEHDSFKNEYLFEWINILIWSTMCFMPIILDCQNIIPKNKAHGVVCFILFCEWIIGWTIMFSNKWTNIRKNYRLISSIILAYQVILFFVLPMSINRNNKESKTITTIRPIVRHIVRPITLPEIEEIA